MLSKTRVYTRTAEARTFSTSGYHTPATYVRVLPLVWKKNNVNQVLHQVTSQKKKSYAIIKRRYTCMRSAVGRYLVSSSPGMDASTNIYEAKMLIMAMVPSKENTPKQHYCRCHIVVAINNLLYEVQVFVVCSRQLQG